MASRSLQRSGIRKVGSFLSDLYPLYEPTPPGNIHGEKIANPVTNFERQRTRRKDTVD
jgi:hypothetical protein